MLAALHTYLGDRRGAVAPLFALSLVSLLAAGALAWDVSRAYALRGELDAAVDAAALAGATQLDQATGARARAIASAQGAFVQNAQRLGDTAETNVAIANADIKFLQDLTTRAEATSDANAHFIEINLTGRNLGVVLGAFAGATGFNVRTHAVAGMGSAICKVPPLLICNPMESTSPSFDGDDYVGKAFLLTPPSGSGGSVVYYPGNFGFLRVGNGADAIKNAMGRSPPLTECFGDTVETEPGQVTSADDWFNTRFDIYRASAAGNKSDPAFAPALNTMIGVKTTAADACTPAAIVPPNSCSDTNAEADGYGFPRDCGMTGNLGSGVWNIGKYFNTNHGGSGAPGDPSTYVPEEPSAEAKEYVGSGWEAYGPAPASGATRPSRFQVYNWERAMLAGTIAKPSWAFSSSQDVSGGSKDFARPMCSTATPAQMTPDRRLISAVVANCTADGVRGRSTVNVIAYLDLFLTAPAKDKTIYGEIVRETPAAGRTALDETARRYWVRLYE